MTASGGAEALANPTVEVRDTNGSLVGENDDWKETQRTEIEGTGLAPSSGAEAALVVNVALGNYTAVVRGSNGTTGVGLVEVYEIR